MNPYRVIHAESQIHLASIGPIDSTTSFAQDGTVNPYGIADAKIGFSRLLRRVATGEEVIIARGGTPVVRLLPVKPLDQQRFGIDAGKFTVPLNFKDPITEDGLDLFDL